MLAQKTRSMKNALVATTTYFLTPKLYQKAFVLTHLRPMFRELKNKPDLVGVEIGVNKGINAKVIVDTLDVSQLFLVDPYLSYIDDGNKLVHVEMLKQIALKRLRRYGDKVKFLFTTSVEAAPSIPSNLDFVYIDANHNYEYVKTDIETWWLKVKEDGVFGGHDIAWQGVFWAVTEFVKKYGLRLNTCGNDWWVIKGERYSP